MRLLFGTNFVCEKSVNFRWISLYFPNKIDFEFTMCYNLVTL